MTRDEGDMILEKAKYDLPAVAGTMPSSGATSPVTREGTVVIELAELMAVWLCYRLVNPAIELGTISASSIFDMREGTCSFSAPEAIIQDCATSQICWRYFGASARMSSAYVDAKTPGLQATYEKLFKAWWSFRFIGFAPYPGGLLEAGMAFSPAQAILDWELWKTHNAIFTPAPAVEDEVPFQDIQAICETGGTFLETDHTAEHFKKVLLHSDILDRSPRRSDVEEASKADGILDRCQAKYEAIRARAPEYIAPDQICKAVDRVVERARKQLVK